MATKILSVSIRKEQYEFIKKFRYSPSTILQEAIDELMADYLEEKRHQHKTFLILSHEDEIGC